MVGCVPLRERSRLLDAAQLKLNVRPHLRGRILDPIQVFATQDVSENELQRFAARLRPQVEVEVDERRASFKSAAAPSWVHILQTPEFWITAFVGNLAWDGIKALVSNRAEIREELRTTVSGALLDFATSVALLRENLTEETAVWIGCPVPDDWFSTLLLIKSGRGTRDCS